MVIKLGSAVITDGQGNIDEAVIRKVASEVAALKASYNIVLVSSGAVASHTASMRITAATRAATPRMRGRQTRASVP